MKWFTESPEQSALAVPAAENTTPPEPSELPEAPAQKPVMSRRGFLAGLGAIGVTAIAVDSVSKNGWPPAAEAETTAPAPITSPEHLTVPEHPFSREGFDVPVEIYTKVYTLDRESVFFTGPNGKVVGESIAFQDFVVEKTRTNKDGKSEKYQYLYTPAVKDANGNYVVEQVRGDWLQYVQQKTAEKYGYKLEELTAHDVTLDFVEALKKKDEPLLRQGIEAGTIRTKLDLDHYFGDKPVQGETAYSRIEYPRNHMTFTGNLAQVERVTKTLPHLVPGLFSVESGFDDSVTNAETGARGISQILPYVWEKDLHRSHYQPEEHIPYTEQVAGVADLFSEIYVAIMNHAYEEPHQQGRNFLEEIKTLFPDQAAFEQEFYIPCMINAYYAGAQTIGELIQAYAKSALFAKHQTDHETGSIGVFMEMTNFGVTCDETLSLKRIYTATARDYVPKVYAYASLLDPNGEELLHPFGNALDQEVASVGQ